MPTVLATTFTILATIVSVSLQAISDHYAFQIDPAKDLGSLVQLGQTSKAATAYFFTYNLPTIFIVDAQNPAGGLASPAIDSSFNSPSGEWTNVKKLFSHPTNSELLFVLFGFKVFQYNIANAAIETTYNFNGVSDAVSMMLVRDNFFLLISERNGKSVLKYIMNYSVLQQQSVAHTRPVNTLVQLRGANSNLFLAGTDFKYIAVMDWTSNMSSSISTLWGLSEDTTHMYVSKAIANQVSFTTWDENLYFASMTGTTLAIDATIILGTGWSPIALVAVEVVQKLIVFYEYEGIYYIIDEGVGHAKQSVAFGKRVYGATYMEGYQFTLALTFIPPAKTSFTSLNITDLIPCETSCLTCNGGLSANDCTSCAAPKYLNKVSGACGLTCPDGTWQDGVKNECTECDVSCSTCSDGTVNGCITCVGARSFNGAGECAKVCPDGKWQQIIGLVKTCELCDTTCTLCTGSALTCTKCSGDRYLSGSSCVLTCPDGQFGEAATNTCQPCDLSVCLTCETTATTCIICANGLFGFEGTCVSSCPVGYFMKPGKCEKCSKNCLECKDQTGECTKCVDSRIEEFLDKCEFCTCPVVQVEYQIAQVSMCTVYGGVYCFDVSLKSSNSTIDLSDFGYKNGPVSILSSKENDLYYSTMFKGKDKVTLQIHPFNKMSLNTTLIEIIVQQEIIGIVNAQSFEIINTPRNSTVIPYQYYEIDKTRSEQVGHVIGTTAKYVEPTVQTAAVADGFVGLDQAGTLFTFTSTLNLISKFRFIDVYYGEVLEPFFASMGENMTQEPYQGADGILKNQVGSKNKLTVYAQPITTLDTFYIKYTLYLLSFILRWFVKHIIKKMKNMKIMTKMVFYFVYFQNIFHFMIFNTFITNGVFMTTRTLLHLKWFSPGGAFYIFDKFMCLIIFFMYIGDLYELLITSLNHKQIVGECSPSILASIESAKAILASKGADYFKEKRQSVLLKKQRVSLSGNTLGNINKKIFTLNDLPQRVPASLLTPQQAKSLNYRKVKDLKYSLNKIEFNQQIVNFSVSNIKNPEHQKFFALRIEGFILRIRYVVYQLLLVALSGNPFLVSSLILLAEMIHLSVYFYYLMRYWYPKNLLVIVSKFNVGFTICYFSFLALILSVSQEEPEKAQHVSVFMQGMGITVAATCLTIETILLFLNISTAIYDMYRDWKQKKQKEKIIKEQWEQIPKNHLFLDKIQERGSVEAFETDKEQKVTLKTVSTEKNGMITKIMKNKKKLRRVVPVDNNNNHQAPLYNQDGGAGQDGTNYTNIREQEENEMEVTPPTKSGRLSLKVKKSKMYGAGKGKSKFTLE